MVINALSSIKKSILPSLTALALAGLAQNAVAQKKIKVVGFYPDYSSAGTTLAQVSSLSEVIYFSIKPPADGNVSDAYIISSINAQRMIDILDQGATKGCGMMLCVGGSAESGNFSGMVSNATTRKKFVTTITDFCVANGLAGIDIDWEFPGAGGASNFTSLAKDLQTAITGKGLVMSTNVNGTATESYTAEALTQFDWVQIMSYDNDWPPGSGPHSTLAQAQTALTLYANHIGSANKGKLLLGVPFYGKGAGGDAKGYRDILAANPSMDPTTDNAGGYNFNGTTTLAAKTNYVIDNGYGGIMIWNLVQDAQDGRLLNSIAGAVKSKGAVIDQLPVSQTLRRTILANTIRPMHDGSFNLRAASAGVYRLTLFSHEGRLVRFGFQTAAAPGANLTWAWPDVASGMYLYKLSGAGLNVSGSAVLSGR